MPFLIDHYPAEIIEGASSQVVSPGSFKGKVLRIETEDIFDKYRLTFSRYPSGKRN